MSAALYHDFDEQLRNGKVGEHDLDCFFSQWFDIEPAGMKDDRAGIDRYFTDPHGKRFSVHYKRDAKAAQTGNLFIEMVHAGPTYLKEGWAYSCNASVLVLYVPLWRHAYCLKPKAVREHINDWLRKYRTKASANRDYWTYGVCVPRDVIEHLAIRTYDLSRIQAVM